MIIWKFIQIATWGQNSYKLIDFKKNYYSTDFLDIGQMLEKYNGHD